MKLVVLVVFFVSSLCGQKVRVSECSLPADIVSIPQVEYPRELKEKKVEGVVLVHVIVSKQGLVTRATVVQKAHPLFNKEALRVAKLVVYKPVYQDGKAIEVQSTIPFNFVLNKPPVP